MTRILIINIARMGDMIQTSPLIAGLKKGEEEVEITLLASEAFQDVASALPGVDRVIPLRLKDIIEPLITANGGLAKSLREVKALAVELVALDFSRVINLTHTNYSATLTALLKNSLKTGLTLDDEGYRTVKGAWAQYYFNSCLNRAQNLFNLVDLHCRIGGVRSPGKLGFNVQPEARKRAQKLLSDALDNVPSAHSSNEKVISPIVSQPGIQSRPVRPYLIGLVPGASTPEKRWPEGAFAAAARWLQDHLSVQFLVFGSREDVPLGDRLVKAIPSAVNLCGRTDIQLLAALLERCDLVISNDTGPMHLAAALPTPVIAVTLGSALAQETAPYGEGHLVLEPRLSCHPCDARLRCAHYSCHQDISPAAVARLAQASLKNESLLETVQETVFNSVKVSRTGFDSEGWGELTPLSRTELTAPTLINQALRQMWRASLDGHSTNGKYNKPQKANTAKLWNDLNRAPDLDVVLEDYYERLREVATIAYRGRSIAQELQMVARDKNQTAEAVRKGEELREIDLQLYRRGYEHPQIMPLVAQFSYSKDNLTGWKLDQLAGQTALLYANLKKWTLATAEQVRNQRNGLSGLNGLNGQFELPQTFELTKL
ncbi:MAG: glycosyltransferase family 9 protein [Calditrichota bacterium]